MIHVDHKSQGDHKSNYGGHYNIGLMVNDQSRIIK